MITRGQFAALLGFLFVAAWIGFDFGDAVLCLVGALVFYLAVAVFLGELHLGELQSRFGVRGGAPPPPPPPMPRSRVR